MVLWNKIDVIDDCILPISNLSNTKCQHCQLCLLRENSNEHHATHVCQWLFLQQECIPVGCVPPAAVAILGGLHQAPPPRSRHPPDQAPHQSRHPPDQAPPWSRHPPDQAPPPCGQNHRRLWKYNLAPTSLRAVKIFMWRMSPWKANTPILPQPTGSPVCTSCLTEFFWVFEAVFWDGCYFQNT